MKMDNYTKNYLKSLREALTSSEDYSNNFKEINMNKLKLNLLTDSLPITAYGFENTSMATQIMSVDEYIKHHKDPYYCESIILPDGRIVLARPSHIAVLDSLLNHINGKLFCPNAIKIVEQLFVANRVE